MERSKHDHVPSAGYRLLVLRGGTAETFILPSSGEVRLGRSPDCEVPIDDARLAEVHASLVVTPELAIRVQFQDDGSENVVMVQSRPVRSGETVRIAPGVVMSAGGVTLVVQVSRTSTRLRLVRSHNYFEARVEDECARAEATQGEFSVVRIRCQARTVARLEHSFGQWLRPMDVVAMYAPDEYEVLLVDTPIDAARLVCDQIVQQLGEGEVEIAIRSFPECRSPETLMPSLGSQSDEGPEVVAKLSAMDRLQPILELVASSSISVLLLGETGVGKEVAANAIHYRSPRASQPLVCVNCGAFSESLLDSELFGHERGAFTGSTGMKVGLIESADGGTLFLDEAGEMPPGLQTKLLRVLEQRQVLRIGAVRPRNIDVRFIAATNRDLEAEVARGAFRRDLYYRLAGTTIVLPPLRERQAEIRGLADQFIEQWCIREGNERRPKLSKEALKWLEEYAWPGNVRELKNTIERAVLLCRDRPMITLEHLPTEKMNRTLPSPIPHPVPSHRSVVEVVRRDLPPRRRQSPGALAAHQSGSGYPQASYSGAGYSGNPYSGSQYPSAPPSPETAGPGSSRSVSGPAPAGSHLAAGIGDADDDFPIDSADERARVVDALERCAWNQTQAAKRLGMSRRTLIKRLEAFALPRPRKSSPP